MITSCCNKTKWPIKAGEESKHSGARHSGTVSNGLGPGVLCVDIGTARVLLVLVLLPLLPPKGGQVKSSLLTSLILTSFSHLTFPMASGYVTWLLNPAADDPFFLLRQHGRQGGSHATYVILGIDRRF